jgi:hypothetical protein
MFETIANCETADNDRKIRFQASLALFAVIFIAILEIWRLASGRTGGRAYWSELVVACFCFVAVIPFKQMPLRVAFALTGMQAAIRVILSRTHVSIGWLHIANVAGIVTKLLGAILVIFVIVDWLSSSRRTRASS